MAVPSVYQFDFSADLPTTPPGSGMVAIYVLVDPRRPDVVRYVGKAVHPIARARHHRKDYHPDDFCRRANWIRSLLRDNCLPALRIIAWVRSQDWVEAEIAAIAAARTSFGKCITNTGDGGDGPTGSRPSAEARAKMSAAKKGKTPHNKGKPMPAHQREKLRQYRAANGHEIARCMHTPEVIAKRAAAITGRKLSSEHVEKMRERLKGQRLSDRAYEASLVYHLGHKQSPETIAKRVATRKANAEARARSIDSGHV